MSQLGIFDQATKHPHPEPSFDGYTFEPELDEERLKTQLASVKRIMSDGEWHTLRELATQVNGSEAGVSARIRDLRKEKFGGHTIKRQRSGDPTLGRFEYRMEAA